MSASVDSISNLLRASYEAVPYEGTAVAATHPDVLATAARLRGMSPPDVERCRLLELGCSTGGNIAAMALTIPNASFVGIDLSPRQIDSARATAHKLGLTNVRFEPLSITDVHEDFGTFDYIVSHGVYSWVPPDVRNALLRVCARHLAPNGLAYVSYNTYPGWHLRGLVRDMLVFHDRESLSAPERAVRGRKLVEFMAEAAPKTDSVYRAVLAEELHTLRAVSDAYFLHEELESINEPIYFAEFARRAAEAGLDYVCEALPSALDVQLPSETRHRLRGWSADRIEFEQYLDYVRNRAFRRSLLCPRGTSFQHEPSPETLPSMHVSMRSAPNADAPDAKEPGVEVFRSLDGVSVTMNHPVVRAALHVLLDAKPGSLPFADLLDRTRARLADGKDAPSAELLADAMLRCALVRLIELHVRPTRGATRLSDRPRVSPLALLQAQDGATVSTLGHANVDLAPFDRLVLRHTDGTRDVAAMTDLVASALARGELTPSAEEGSTHADLREAVLRAWQQFLAVSLLVA